MIFFLEVRARHARYPNLGDTVFGALGIDELLI